MLTVLTVRFPQAGFRGRAMATGPITKTNVDALTCPPSKDREILWDSDHREAVRGFGIAAFRNGGKCSIRLQSKVNLWKEARTKFPGLSERQFNRAREQAIEETKAYPWSGPGAPRKSNRSTN